MPMTTRAAIQITSGQPLIIDELQLADPRPEQAVVKLLASGICHSQVHELHDDRARPTTFGHEATGVVIRAGSEVTRVREGDQVIVTWVRRHALPRGQQEDRWCGASYRGSPIPWPVFTWGEHTLVAEEYLVPIAAGEPADLCCIIGCAVLTGAGAVIHTARVQPGESVAVFGAGGVGLSAVRAAALRGADPIIAVDLRPAKLALAREFGATHTVDAGAGDPVAAILELSGDQVIVTWVRRHALPRGQQEDRWCGASYRGSPIPWPVFTWGEHTLVAEEYLVPIAAGEPADLCCIIGCAVLTGAGAVIHTARVQPGESVAVFGAGGVGLSAVRAAALRGADPIIAVDLRPAKLALAREFGATHTVDAGAGDPVAAILELSGGGVDYAFDAIGVRQTTETINEVTRPGSPGAANTGGTAILIGVPGREMTLNPRAMLSGQRSYRTSLGAAYPDRDFPIYLRWFRDGLFPLEKLVTDRYRLEQINEACAALQAGKIMGRAILEYE